jgi:hypothetical protein
MRQCRGCESADGPVKKLLVLIKLDNVFFGRSIVEETSPRLVSVRLVSVPAADGLKVRRRFFRLQVKVVLERSHQLSLPSSIENGIVVAEKTETARFGMQNGG